MSRREIVSISLLPVLSLFLSLSTLTPLLGDPIEIVGTVFIDHNANGTMERPDFGIPAIRVQLFHDRNMNGEMDSWEKVVEESISIAGGRFRMMLHDRYLIHLLSRQRAKNYILRIHPEDLGASHALTRDLLSLQEVWDKHIYLGFFGISPICYAVGDGSDPDHLVSVNMFSGVQYSFPPSLDVRYLEAVTALPSGDLFAVNNGTPGRIELSSSRFIPFPLRLQTANGNQGIIKLQDIDGLSFSRTMDRIYATVRRKGQLDALIQLDFETGQLIKDGFGKKKDYLVLRGQTPYNSLDDIAFDPESGELFGVCSKEHASSFDLLVKISTLSGYMEVIDTLRLEGHSYLNDVEGLSFNVEGKLYGTTGDDCRLAPNAFFEIDPKTAGAKIITSFYSSSDFEACECNNKAMNRIRGSVFEDHNENGVWDEDERFLANMKIKIYRDEDEDGKIGDFDTIVDSIKSDAQGMFSWQTSHQKQFIAEFPPTIIPDGTKLTSSPIIAVPFQQAKGGMYLEDMNFGLAHHHFRDQWNTLIQPPKQAAQSIARLNTRALPANRTEKAGSRYFPPIAQTGRVYLRFYMDKEKNTVQQHPNSLLLPSIFPKPLLGRFMLLLRIQDEIRIQLPGWQKERFFLQMYTQKASAEGIIELN